MDNYFFEALNYALDRGYSIRIDTEVIQGVKEFRVSITDGFYGKARYYSEIEAEMCHLFSEANFLEYIKKLMNDLALAKERGED